MLGIPTIHIRRGPPVPQQPCIQSNQGAGEPVAAPAALEKASPQNREGGKLLSGTKGGDSLQPGHPHAPSDFTSGTVQPLLGPLNENRNT